jgi:predicted acylesterase/phospholipase RssA
MASEIIVALVSLAGTAIGSGCGAFASSRLTNYRLEQLEKKFDRFSNNTERIALLEQRSNEHDKRISKLEEKS